MSEKHSIAMRKRWAAIDPEQKFTLMQKVSRAKYDNMSQKKRKQIAIDLVKARKEKHATTN